MPKGLADAGSCRAAATIILTRAPLRRTRATLLDRQEVGTEKGMPGLLSGQRKADSMYAVVKTGGKQFRVTPDDVIKVEKLDGQAGDIIQLETVLMLGGEGEAEIGAPTVSGASIAAEILEQGRDKKITVFKKRRRQNYRRKKGHRQPMTVLRVREILTGGASPSVTASTPKAKDPIDPAATPPRGATDNPVGAFTEDNVAEATETKDD
ncbi:LSU ribosomal protein L21P [Parvularcula bermudensis HTCC2503]|uniref:Large ribosomal subunit protein bL21 n=2 Tax=Parvularcula TaxID=208215 RepID=E0TG94_PARBH|nr:LSU ribosomal protein L21P [Parvularcula bermudensis HTCC2503]